MGADPVKDLYPLRAANLASRVFGGEAVVMNPADSTLFNLNETATAIWLGADGKTTLRQIVERDICPAWDVDPEAALEDAERFTRELAAHSILSLSAEPV
jgi:hypothetical protein